MAILQLLNRLSEDRVNLLSRTKDLTEKQYNLIPDGFNNNIIWNLGHLLVTGEGMLYRNSPDLRPIYDLGKAHYQKGSRPEGFVSNEDISFIRGLLSRTVFAYKSATGLVQRVTDSEMAVPATVPIINEDQMRFLLFHEGLHYNKIAKLMEKVGA